jgi:hypothetical protein
MHMHIETKRAAGQSQLGTALMATVNLRSAQHDLLEGVRSSLKIIDPSEAQKWRETKHFERQRRISIKNVQRLAREMQLNRFIRALQIYICRLPDGREYIVNGNHTLEAIILSGISQVLTVTVIDVQDIDEAGRYYAVFDSQHRRTLGDTLRATGKDQDIPDVRYVTQAVSLINANFGQSSQGEPVALLDKIDHIDDYEDAAFTFADLTTGASKEVKRFARRAGIMAVALATLRFQPSCGSEFWRRFVQDDGLRVGMPERTLLTYLRNASASTGQQPRGETARAAALAWNAAFRGQERVLLKPNAMSQFVLLGTPWQRGV